MAIIQVNQKIKDEPEEMSVVKLTDKHVIFVEVNTGNMSNKKAKEYLAEVKESISSIVKPAQVVVVSNNVKITVFKTSDK